MSQFMNDFFRDMAATLGISYEKMSANYERALWSATRAEAEALRKFDIRYGTTIERVRICRHSKQKARIESLWKSGKPRQRRRAQRLITAEVIKARYRGLSGFNADGTAFFRKGVLGFAPLRGRPARVIIGDEPDMLATGEHHAIPSLSCHRLPGPRGV